jgi:M6 family metalloprotease-like protein
VLVNFKIVWISSSNLSALSIIFSFMNKRLYPVIILALLFGLLAAPLNAAPPKAGAKCTKAGASSTVAGKKFTCVKSGNRLVWNKGVTVKAAAKPEAPAVPTTPTTPATPATPTVPAAPAIKVSDASAYRNISECKLVNGSNNRDVNQSHDSRNWILVDTKKTVRVLIFPVDFSDLVSKSQDSPDFKSLIKDFEAFYSSQSNNTMKFAWTVPSKFSRMTKSVQSYGLGARGTGNSWSLYNDMHDLALKSYKREDFDFFIGSAPTSTIREDIAVSPAFGATEKSRWPGTFLGGDYWSNGASWTIPTHEFGHSGLGLADLYNYDAAMLGQAGFAQQFKYMGVYDLMNWAGGSGLELTSWNRWIGGLIADKQMLCLPDATTTTLLKPIQLVNDEVKGLVIPITKSSAIVIENRAALGFDQGLTEGAQGVIAYFVDTAISSGYGPMQVIRKQGSSHVWFIDNALKVGEVLTHKGYSIKVLGASKNEMYVEVKKEG